MKSRSLASPFSGVLTAPVVGALVTTLLATLLATFVVTPAEALQPLPAVAGAPDPAKDYPRMPQDCTPSREKIPSKPVACALNAFDEGRPTVLLWGDSHAWMFIPALQTAAEGRDVNLVAVMMGSCPPMDNAVKPNAVVPPCYRSNALGVSTVRRLAASGQPYKVVLSGSWERYVHALKVGDRKTYIGRMAQAMKDGLPRLVAGLDELGADVDVVGQVPTVPAKHGTCAAGDQPFACAVSRGKAMPEETPTRNYVAKTLGPLLGTRPAIDITPRMCTTRLCNGTVGSTLTWFDDLHLSASMSTELASYFAPSIDAVAPAAPEPEEPTCTIPIICP